jgi:hypothetical protein
VTIKAVNKAVAALGSSDELVKADGYFYFWGYDASNWPSSSVMANRVNDLTLEQWVEEYKSLKAYAIRHG